MRGLLPGPALKPEGTTSGSGQGPSLRPGLHPRATQTKVACEPCRKRKTKCGGEHPKCSACINKGLECHYQASNQDFCVLKRKYDEIEEKASIYEQLHHFLISLPERESNGILRRLREGADAATIIRQVKDGDLLVQTRPMSSNSHAEAMSRANGAPLQLPCKQPSHEQSVFKCFCELSELVYQSLYLVHSPRKPLTARALLRIFTDYLNWYDGIPDFLPLGHNFAPTVLFVHMYYHFAILQLFRPFIKLRIIWSQVFPRNVCLRAASAIQGLLKSYSQLYTLKRAPSFMPYFALTSTIMDLTIMAAAAQTNDLDMTARTDPQAALVICQLNQSITPIKSIKSSNSSFQSNQILHFSS
ncbi:hypothetical protein FOTG_17868 [Fusarium oxysporum f. sp. vasinfectum 25433]|uniref:Zn(2)-C6 fungal-type domain-containing protein n=1 Tax=Fusarium oxysporum f. sp. vasinfectum 25433 TaxID=1089449 RepID=X0KJ70_FUSOX|nr:hypothetical protein FOTG_17868 [Fusarium oxysporum f. sp. vasinfectum 25433]